MAEYIEREAVLEIINKLNVASALYAGRRIINLPSADVSAVRHGRWDDEHKCTVCHNEAFYKISNIRPDYDYDWEENLVETGDYIWDIEWVETAYCPNCGAIMDLED